MTDISVELLTKAQYFRNLKKRISSTEKGRIVVATMTFRPDLEEIKQLLDELGGAAERGVAVTLFVDSINFMVGEKRVLGPLFFNKGELANRYLLPQFRTIYVALNRLKSRGGHYVILNVPSKKFSNIYAGRSHMKFTVINDQVYVGGCNLSSKEQLDIMVRWKSKKTADYLVTLSQGITETKGNVHKSLAGKDARFAIKKNAALLLDAGTPNQSLIMNTALKMIDMSKNNIFITTQFFVNKIIAEHLWRAERRGVQVTIIYNHPKNHHTLERIMVNSIILRERRRLPKIFFQERLDPDSKYLHAKLLITDNTLLAGSHNYFPLLIHFGTAELCIQINNLQIAQYAKTMLLQQLRSDI